MPFGEEYKCLEIRHLQQMPRAGEARALLEKVAAQVQPIMRRHRWTVPRLAEFMPRFHGLYGINMNRGAEIRVRLRPNSAPDTFLEWHTILGTMLHELVHNEISAHNAAFYKMLDELWQEAEELMDAGITGSGQGFDAPSMGRLGAHSFIPQHNPPEHLKGDAMRKAAEARAAKQRLMAGGPRKLGGGSRVSGIDHRALTPAQAAAAAAERRAQDNQWCGAEHTAEEMQREMGSGDGSDAAGAAPAATKAPAAAAAPEAAAAAPAAAGQVAEAGRPQQQQERQQHQHQQQQQQQHQQQHQQHAQQEDQQHQQTMTAAAPVQQQPLQSAAELQEQWQQHLRTQQDLRQQRRRKRAADNAIDLTLSDDDEGAGGIGPGQPGWEVACPCCAAAVEGPLDAAVMARLRARTEQQALCALHAAAAGEELRGARVPGGPWTCGVCTLLNRPGTLACEACLTARQVVV